LKGDQVSGYLRKRGFYPPFWRELRKASFDLLRKEGMDLSQLHDGPERELKTWEVKSINERRATLLACLTAQTVRINDTS